MWHPWLTLISLANRIVCHPVHHHPRVDHRASDHHALRPVRVGRTLPFRIDRQLRRARWKIELVRRDDLDMLVRLRLLFSFFSGLTHDMSERRYIIIALVFWFYPGTELDGLLTCSA